MDLIKTLLVYMMMLVSAGTEAAPAITPFPPQLLPTATPYQTVAPTLAPTATAAPTATPAPYTTLYVGDRGETVKKLQRRLAELGYLTDTVDGIYGQNTKRAVERFQYYNDLKVDGIAGRATQSLLFESTAVVTAPPEITQGPTATPTTPASVTVPVYYVDQNNQLLKRVNMICYGTTTIYANSNNVSADYSLISASAVTVTVQRGVATPASVTFRYQRKSTATPAPSTVVVPVYYRTEGGALLYQTSVTLPRGGTSYVTASTSLVPSGYQLVGSSTVAVSVTSLGAATPATVMFTFRSVLPTQTPAPTETQIPVYYVAEGGGLLAQTFETVAYNAVTPVYANGYSIPAGYSLVSSTPVYVTVNAYGYANPASVTFTLRLISTTTAPTATPSNPTTPPAPSYQEVTVYYLDEEGTELNRETQLVQLGTATTLYPNAALVPAGYTLVSVPSVDVSVDERGYQSPSRVAFRYAAPPQPTNPPLTSFVTVRLLEQGTELELHSYQAEVTLNQYNTLYANFSSLPVQYIPAGDTMIEIFVDANGAPNPAPVFYFANTEAPTATPPATEAPTATPPATEAPTATPPATEAPTATPPATEAPTATPPATEAPTATPPATEAPTATPPATEAPTATPPATEAPTATPPAGLTEAGGSIQLNGGAVPLFWFKDEAGNAMISLQTLTGALGWSYAPNAAPSTLYGHEVAVAYDLNGLQTLTIDGASHLSNGRVWNNDLYVNAAFLRALGAEVVESADSLSITFPN